MTLGSGGGNVLSVVVEDEALEHVCLRTNTRFFLLCGTDCWLLLGLLRSAVASAEAINTDFCCAYGVVVPKDLQSASLSNLW